MSAMLASLRETCEGHKLQLGGLVEESGKLEGEDQEINRNIGVFESIRVPEAEAEAARTSAVAAAASAEASNSAAFESSNGNEAFRSSLFHRTAIERVQARADVLSAAEDEVPKYTSAEQRAREKLLLEQRRLSEALSITSSLSLHLKESQIAKEGAPAYQKPRHRQAVSEAEDALQEARKIQVGAKPSRHKFSLINYYLGHLSTRFFNKSRWIISRRQSTPFHWQPSKQGRGRRRPREIGSKHQQMLRWRYMLRMPWLRGSRVKDPQPIR